MVFVFCVFFFGFMVFVSLRRSFTDLDFIQLIGQIDAFNGISFVNIARKEFEIYPGIGYWLTLYDLNKFENFPYSNAAYVFKTLFFWLPSELFGFQEAPFTSYLGFYLTNDPLFSCNITSIGELALMFGWPSILVLGVTCGIFTYLLDIKYLRQFKNFNFLIFAVIILQIMRGPFYYFLSQILLLTLAWWLIYMFFIRKERSVWSIVLKPAIIRVSRNSSELRALFILNCVAWVKNVNFNAVTQWLYFSEIICWSLIYGCDHSNPKLMDIFMDSILTEYLIGPRTPFSRRCIEQIGVFITNIGKNNNECQQ